MVSGDGCGPNPRGSYTNRICWYKSLELCYIVYSISIDHSQEKRKFSNMKVIICLAAVLCVVRAGFVAGPAAVVRAPHFDSAIIKSERLGGNFAWSTAESHAIATVNPVVQNVVAPVGVSYTAHTLTAPVARVAAPLAVPWTGHIAAPWALH
ncbi:hypothetical protein L9F63_007157 [Diploptera punctata]|uniref:Uncharacterized protein n=1 Tax=Diploptera punctata TaxID=6984 RepID=A0AAD8E3J7_DIPPU|nr:hypothetical protein L9F63_007157 [Diploptera punctata]